MTKYQFYSQDRTLYGTINVWWEYNQSGRSITITDVTYNNDMWWCVGASMRLTVNWSDGSSTDMANGDWNWTGGGLVTSNRGGGFINTGGALGIFDNESHPSHTFGGNSGGFGISFGATKAKLNNLDVEYYKALPSIAGDNPSVTFITPPSINCNGVSSRNPGVWKLSSSINGINWGVGYSSTKLTATVNYTFLGKAYSYTAGTWTDGRTSCSVNIDKFDNESPWVNGVPAGANATVTWRAETNIGAAACATTVFCKAPTTPSFGSMTLENPSVYAIKSSINGISWGDYYKSRRLYAHITGTIDGKAIDWTYCDSDDGRTSDEFLYDAIEQKDAEPWLRVPDDADLTVTWNAVIGVGYGNITGVISRTIHCQPSYTAYVLEEGINDGKPVEADLLVSESNGSAPSRAIRRITTLEETQ